MTTKNLNLIVWESKVHLNLNKRKFCYLIASWKVNLQKILHFQFVTRRFFLVEKISIEIKWLLIDEIICNRKLKKTCDILYICIYISNIFAYFTTLERLSICFLYKSIGRHNIIRYTSFIDIFTYLPIFLLCPVLSQRTMRNLIKQFFRLCHKFVWSIDRRILCRTIFPPPSNVILIYQIKLYS